jgi:Flp pilus assembly protein TadD
MITYKIEEGQEENDILLKVIKKEGEEIKKIESSFTLAQIEKQIKEFEKTVTEKRAQAKIHEAEMGNIIIHHPEVASIEEKVQQATFVYVNSKMEAAANTQIADAYQKAADDLKEEVVEIKKQLNING